MREDADQLAVAIDDRQVVVVVFGERRQQVHHRPVGAGHADPASHDLADHFRLR
ncbi:MAG: hypothetical protein QE272_11850 [Nevskia sp.]|nr:hypothetical protein [Nevskia sp.]